MIAVSSQGDDEEEEIEQRSHDAPPQLTYLLDPVRSGTQSLVCHTHENGVNQLIERNEDLP